MYCQNNLQQNDLINKAEYDKDLMKNKVEDVFNLLEKKYKPYNIQFFLRKVC